MNKTKVDFANSVMNDPDYVLLLNLDDKFMVFKRSQFSGMYMFLIWDERLGGYENMLSTSESFCLQHLDASKLLRASAIQSIELTSKGAKRINKKDHNN